jgi:acetyl-CoA/propionyl-CoA carboxylase biotin carboxyl carrier protein
MFRIADGQPLGYPDPQPRAHSIEFRINAEDPGRNFLPAPGKITRWQPPSGPGVRLDTGYREGMTVPQAFDSLIAKLIVTGSDRKQALQRARRALGEFDIAGMPTVLGFHRAVTADPAFTSEPFSVHTRWIETEFEGPVEPFTGEANGDHPDSTARERITVEVGGKRLEVVLPPGFLVMGEAVGEAGGAGRQAGRTRQRTASRGRHTATAAGGDTLTSPMQGTIVKLVASEGDQVSAGDTIVVLEAMKMEQPLAAHKDGTVTRLEVTVGQSVSSGEAICQISD